MNGGMTMDIKQGIQDVLYLIITGILPLLITYGIKNRNRTWRMISS